MKLSDYEVDGRTHYYRQGTDIRLMSAQRKMDLRRFFSSVTKKRHIANLGVQDCRDEEKASAEEAQ